MLTAPDAADVALERIATRDALVAVGTPREQAGIIVLRVVAGLGIWRAWRASLASRRVLYGWPLIAAYVGSPARLARRE